MAKDKTIHGQLLSIDDLRPAPYNSKLREISSSGMRGLKASLSKFGDLSGIVWNKRTGNLVAGHQRLDQLKLMGAKLEQANGKPEVVAGGRRFAVRVVDMSEAEERAANLTANNDAICGSFTDAVSSAALEVLTGIGEAAFEELGLDKLAGGSEKCYSEELKEWDASDLSMRALFVFSAPIELQPKIRDMLSREFPGVAFEEQVIHE